MSVWDLGLTKHSSNARKSDPYRVTLHGFGADGSEAQKPLDHVGSRFAKTRKTESTFLQGINNDPQSSI